MNSNFRAEFPLGCPSGRFQAAVIFRTVVVVACALAVPLFQSPSAAAEEDPYKLVTEAQSEAFKGNYENAIGLFTRAVEVFGPGSAQGQQVLYERAKALFRMGDSKRSWKEVANLLRYSNLDGEVRASALHLRGVLNVSRDHDQDAVQDFTAAIKTRHNDMKLRATSFTYRGWVFVRLGEHDKAISDLDQAIRLDPDSAMAYAARGMAYLRKDDLARARTDVDTALSMNPDQQTIDMANKVLKSLSFSESGPDRISIPFSDDGHIFVQVRFTRNGKPHRFLLDTGATHSLISKELLEKISAQTEVTRIGYGLVRTADGETHKVTRYKVRDVYLYNLPLGDIEVHVFSERNKILMNLLGAKSLKQVAISIDTGAQKAEIRRIDADNRPQD